MEDTYSKALVEMGVSLTTMVVKGTTSAVNNKIKAIKDEKSVERIRNTYDEIINELLSEREEAIRIAQVYKNELERIVISDEDIVHLHNTISRIIALFGTFSGATSPEEVAKKKAQEESFEQLKELISVDTLKTMQLLGFNYKAAIGEPLTEICANAIASLGNKSNGQRKR